MDFKVSEEYRKIVPKLKPSEYTALEISLKQEGQLYPIITNSEGTILDGMHRFEILTKLGKEIKYEIRDFPSKLEEKQFVIVVNLKRRHLNSFQKAEMGIPLLEVEAELAKHRHGKLASDEADLGKATEKTAKQIGISRATFERAKKVIEEAPETLRTLCREEDITINGAFGVTKALEGVPETVQETLIIKLKDGILEAPEVIKTINSTKAVKEQIESEREAVREKAEELFKDKFWTPELDSKKAKWEIEEIAGDPHEQVTKEFPIEMFASFEEAQAWAVERNGVCKGKVEKWLIKYDPIKYKKLEKEAEKSG